MSSYSEAPGEIAGTLIGSSPAAVDLRHETELAGRVCLQVLITGEGGVGKHRLAQIIHRRSVRCHGPFIVLQCTSVADANPARELFGRPCRLESALDRADGGTLFLADVERLPPNLQARLTQFLQTGEILGSSSDIGRQVNVRIIAATTAGFDDTLRSGRFSEDLYYLLNTMYLRIPPLRERLEDVAPLLEFFTKYYSRKYGVAAPALSAETLSSCQAHNWPGNLRQLQATAAMLAAPPNRTSMLKILESTLRLARQPELADRPIL